MELSTELKEKVEERITQGVVNYDDLSELLKTESCRNGLL
jgi:hypothetical protein